MKNSKVAWILVVILLISNVATAFYFVSEKNEMIEEQEILNSRQESDDEYLKKLYNQAKADLEACEQGYDQ